MFLLLFLFILIGPRFATVMWWLFQPERFNLAFTNFLVPILGIIFLPWTTLMYMLVFPGGLSGFDILFLILAFLGDMASYFGGAKYRPTQQPTEPAEKVEPSA